MGVGLLTQTSPHRREIKTSGRGLRLIKLLIKQLPAFQPIKDPESFFQSLFPFTCLDTSLIQHF